MKNIVITPEVAEKMKADAYAQLNAGNSTSIVNVDLNYMKPIYDRELSAEEYNCFLNANIVLAQFGAVNLKWHVQVEAEMGGHDKDGNAVCTGVCICGWESNLPTVTCASTGKYLENLECLFDLDEIKANTNICNMVRDAVTSKAILC